MPHNHLTAQITRTEDIRNFVFAGRALFTIVSRQTGKRFTFKVQTPRDNKDMLFAHVLTGPDNEASYTYLGFIRAAAPGKLNPGRKGQPNNVSFKALDWFLRQVQVEETPDTVEFYHSGKCGRCSRTLTVPESIETGLGPVCAGR